MAGNKWQATLIAVAALLTLVLLGPTVWARGQINLYTRDLVRIWQPDRLIPTDDACPPLADAAQLQAMQARLAQADGADAHRLLHQGELACLQGDVRRAGAIWMAGQASYLPDPVLLLDAGIAGFSDGRILETPEDEGIGRYAASRSAASKKAADIAIAWQEMSFAYDPSTKTAGRLAALYSKNGQKADAKNVWGRLEAAYPESNAVHWQARGKALEQKKEWAGAMNAYEKAATLEKLPADAFKDFLQAGVMGVRAKAFDEAEGSYQKAIAVMPDKIDGYLGVADVFRTQKRYDDAIAWYQKTGALFPQDYRPPYYLGLVARAQKDYERALDYFEQSLTLKPNNAGVLYYKATVLDALQRRGEAIGALSQAIEHHPSHPESWRKLLAKWQRYPDYAQDPDRWWERGRAAEKEKDWAQAAAIYAEGAGKALPPDDYRLLEREALMHRYLKEWDAAAALYEDLVHRYPEEINAYLGRGEVARSQKLYDEAAGWFARAQELFPQDYRPPYYLGLVARAQKDYEKALDYFEQSLTLKPNNAGVLYYKALVLEALQRRVEAISVMALAVELHPSHPESWRKLLAKWQRYPDYAQDPDRWWERGRAAEKEKDWAQAAAIYAEGAGKALPPDDYRLLEREALMHRYLKEWDAAAALYEDLIQRYPEEINAYLGRGEVARAQGQYEEAQTWFEKARNLFPQDYRPPYYLGLTARGAKNYEEALAFFDQTLRLKPDYVYALYYKAQVLKALERQDEAISVLSRAIEKHPNHPESWQNQLADWQGEQK